MKRDSCSREDASAKIASQMPLSSKRDKSTYVIENDGTKEETVDKVDKLPPSWVVGVSKAHSSDRKLQLQWVVIKGDACNAEKHARRRHAC